MFSINHLELTCFLYFSATHALTTNQIERVIGKEVVFSCKNIRGNTDVLWVRRNENGVSTLYAVGWIINLKLLHHERFQLIGEKGGEQYDLKISNLMQADAGLYDCIIQSGNSIVKYKLTVKAKGNYTHLGSDK